MEYKYQLDKIQELDIPSGQSYRGDCIFCLNRNTLSVRNENGKIIGIVFMLTAMQKAH